MKREQFEKMILDYLDGNLSVAEKLLFEGALAEDPSLAKLFMEYQEVMQLEASLASESFSLHPSFSVQVLENIDSDVGFFRKLYMETIKRKHFLTGAATSCCLIIAILLLQQPGARHASLPQDASHSSSELVKRTERSEEQRNAAQETSAAPVTAAPGKISENNSQTAATTKGAVKGYATRRTKEGLLLKKEIGIDSSPQVKILQSPPSEQSKRRHSAPLASGQVAKESFLEDIAAEKSLPAPGSTFDSSFQPASGEVYKSWRENPRTSVTQEAVSTFSVDVDTGSYSNARRFLRNGTLPPAESIRIEEFINYFDYSYPKPQGQPFAVSYELAPSPLENGRHLLKIGVQAKEAEHVNTPWNLVFLIDVSGSMATPDKLALIKNSLRVLVHAMRPNDSVAIVTYAGHSGVLLDATKIDQKERIINAIDSLGAGGGTHGSAGIQTAYTTAKKNFLNDGVNRVILLTDGDFNVGTTSHDALINLIENKRKEGVTLTTIGVGAGNYHEAMMEQLANKGNGNYFYLDTLKEARKVFGKDLVANMQVVAKDVKVQIEFNPAHISHYRLVGYDNRRLNKEDFNNDQIDAGEVGSGHSVTALYEIALKDSAFAQQLHDEYRYAENKKITLEKDAINSAEFAFLKIRYKEPKEQQSKKLSIPLEAKQILKSTKDASVDFRFVAAVSYLGHTLRNSRYKGNYQYQDIATLLRESLGSDPHGYRRELLELVENLVASQ